MQVVVDTGSPGPPASTIRRVSDWAHRLWKELSTPRMVDAESFLKIIPQVTPRMNNTQSRRLSLSTIQWIHIFWLIYCNRLSIIRVLQTVAALVFSEGKHIFQVICTVFMIAVQHLLLTIREVSDSSYRQDGGSRRLSVSLICQLPVSSILRECDSPYKGYGELQWLNSCRFSKLLRAHHAF